MNHKIKRNVLLVGSLPFEDEHTAMNLSMDILRDKLHSIPDGEVGEKSERYPMGHRTAWIQSIIDLCEEDTDSWKVIKQGERNEKGLPVSYEKVIKLHPKLPPNKMLEKLDFKWVEYFKRSYPIFKKLRQEKQQDSLKFQVGLPTGLVIAMTMMKPLTAIRYAAVFNQRIAYEANEILKLADPGDVVFQIEVPGELAMAYKLPKFLVSLSVQTIIGLANKINVAPSFGIHICFGDLNNEALTQAKTLNKMVHFTNKLVQKWPATHQLDYIHFPLAEASDPPPMDAAYYKVLKNINMPDGARFIAGFIHEKRTYEEHKVILETLENTRGHRVDVACSCGLGRRTPEVAMELIKLSSDLTHV